MIFKSHMNALVNLILLQSCITTCFAKDFYTKDSTNFKNDKLRICIVENRGTFRRAEKYCPTLEKQTNIECVIGVDRLDCARRISKGQAHFGVFSSEDLVGARWASLEILVTSEIRFHAEANEYDVVVVVDNEANIHSPTDLKNSRLCHPGKGLESNWNDIIADYLENTMIPKQCETDITLVESRIKATAEYFGKSCKAGPWVSDPVEDALLKKKYPSLCEICYNPTHCGIGDKHWGRKGPLYCLTSGAGEVAFVRLDDVRNFFGFTGLTPESYPESYSFLCHDGNLQPLTTKYPCPWISKPWSVVAARRSHSQKVLDLFKQLNTTTEWQQALIQLLESYHVNITNLDFPITIGDYLDKSPGYQSAHSFPACHPPRQIVFCTTTIIEFSKCSWLQEVSTVYGIEPNIQCFRGETIHRCLDDVAKGVADLVLVNQDLRMSSEKKFNLTTILHEFSADFTKNYVTIALVKDNSNIKSFAELKGKIACFPSYQGAAHIAATKALQHLNLTDSTCASPMTNFFSYKSCYGEQKSRFCDEEFFGEAGALKCLHSYGDVAFMNLEDFKNLTENNAIYYRKSLTVLCPFERQSQYSQVSDTCYISWTSKGVLLTSVNKSPVRIQEIKNTLKSMDLHFGKQKIFRSGNVPFSMFGPYDKFQNVLFRDATDGLKTVEGFKKISNFERNSEKFNEIANNESQCSSAVYQLSSHPTSFFLFFFVAAISVALGSLLYFGREFLTRKLRYKKDPTSEGYEIEDFSTYDG